MNKIMAETLSIIGDYYLLDKFWFFTRSIVVLYGLLSYDKYYHMYDIQSWGMFPCLNDEALHLTSNEACLNILTLWCLHECIRQGYFWEW